MLHLPPQDASLASPGDDATAMYHYVPARYRYTKRPPISVFSTLSAPIGMSTVPLLPHGHTPRTNHTGICWLLRVQSPATAAAALLQASPKVRFAALNLASDRMYVETKWPPVRASALRRLLDGLLVEIELKPVSLTRENALLSIGQTDWLTGEWRLGGQGRRTDRLRLQQQSEDSEEGRHRRVGVRVV